MGVLLAPGSIMPMAVLSGFFVNQQDMSWVFRWFSYIDYLNYGWQARSLPQRAAACRCLRSVQRACAPVCA